MLRKSLISIALLLIAAAAFAQSIDTVAGGGTDDGRPALAVAMDVNISGIAFDAAGNLYYSDELRNIVRKWSPLTGLVRTIAGNGAAAYSGDGGPAIAAALYQPRGLAIGPDGALYIAEWYGCRIRRVDLTSGIISTIAGTGVTDVTPEGRPATLTALWYPSAIAFDAAGNLFIANGGANNVLKVDAATHTVTRIAGDPDGIPGISPDGGLARDAKLVDVMDIAISPAGKIVIVENVHRVRQIDLATGIITTIAGNGQMDDRGYGTYSGDGGPATAAGLNLPEGIAFDRGGNLFIADWGNRRVRMVDAHGVITTVMGNGSSKYVPGAAPLSTGLQPMALAFDAAGNLFVGTQQSRILRYDPAAKTLSPWIGGGYTSVVADGGPATASQLSVPAGLTLDADGNLLIADLGTNRIRKVSRQSGYISTFAGDGGDTYNGEGRPAATSSIGGAIALAIDAQGDVYASIGSRILRIARTTGVVSTYAGTSAAGSDGDGGAATAARIDAGALAFDRAGNLLFVDGQYEKTSIRKVDTHGTISTFAVIPNAGSITVDSKGIVFVGTTDFIWQVAPGATPQKMTATPKSGPNGTCIFTGDNVPASEATVCGVHGLSVDPAGNLVVADTYDYRIRMITTGGIMKTIAGTGFNQGSVIGSFTGDGGPALAAGLARPFAVAAAADGTIYLADTDNGRVRRISPCATVTAPALKSPANASASVQSQAGLSWSGQRAAFHYDVYLDTVNPPQRIIAADVTQPTYSPANLDPLTTYYWKIVAKGDPFCFPASTASSDVYSFTTSGTCSAPASFNATASSDGASMTIKWDAAARAGSYDVSFGTSNPPRPYAQNVTATSLMINGIAPGTTYYWSIAARAACDATRKVETSVQSLTSSGSCGQPAAVVLNSPAAASTTVPATATLSWSPAAGASSYDLYLGTGSNPPLYLADLEQTTIAVPRLTAGAAYTWKVVARPGCDAARSVSSEVRSFTVSACGTPAAPAIGAMPASVPAGATYAISWSDAAGLDEAGSYLVERSTDPAFNTIVDQQQTSSRSASFTTTGEATYYHRVRSIAGCNGSRSEPSSAGAVTVKAGAPVVVFTVLPQAVITSLGDRLEDQRASFTLENLGGAPVQVAVAPQLLGSIPFFTVSDPLGGDTNMATLEPRKAKTFEIRFSGPPNNQEGSYQGSIYVAGVTQPLAFNPQAYVNLRVGAVVNAARPKLLVGGVESGFAFFAPAAGNDDSARPPLQIDLFNSGSMAMEVAGEIGPEAWLKLEKDWNATAVPASSFRTLRLSTQRIRAVAGSALPRYTYLTVRNKAGQSARMLIEDSGGVIAGRGRSGPAASGDASLIVPVVRSGAAAQSVLTLTNSNATAAPVEVVWTPEGADGFDANAVKRATIVVPANDVVVLTDPAGQIFGATAESYGSIEIRGAADRIGSLVVRSDIRALQSGGGAYTVGVPTADSGEGARADAPQRVAGISSNTSLQTSLMLTETSGRDSATVHVVLHDALGTKRGEQTVTIGRYGFRRIADVAQTLGGGAATDGGRIDIDVPSGGGTVLGVAIVSDRVTGSGVAVVAQPVGAQPRLSALGRRVQTTASGSSTQTQWIAGIISNGGTHTTVGLSAGSAANVRIEYRDASSGQTLSKSITVSAGQTIEYEDALKSLWNATSGAGTLTITSDSVVTVYARVHGPKSIDALPVVSLFSESLAGSGSARPLIADGLEQSIERGAGRTTGLTVTELAGQSASFVLRFYAPGNRSMPIALKEFTIPANGQLHLDNIFEAMGLETGSDVLENRRKNQVNVEAVLTPSGGGLLAAFATLTDNTTGELRMVSFVPAGGVPATTPQRMSSSGPGRRRSVGH